MEKAMFIQEMRDSKTGGHFRLLSDALAVRVRWDETTAAGSVGLLSGLGRLQFGRKLRA
jgi:hypothetical protein